MKCEGFAALMEWQAVRMEEAITEDKWFLSEQAGHDVGKKTAGTHFEAKHLTRCATSWRVLYCGTLCEHRETCLLGRKLVSAIMDTENAGVEAVDEY